MKAIEFSVFLFKHLFKFRSQVLSVKFPFIIREKI